MDDKIKEHKLRLLRHRFCEDSGAPIQVLQEPYFSQRLRLFEKEFGTLTDYENYVKYVDNEFNGNIEAYLEHYHSLRDRIINEVSTSKAYRDFQEDKKITEEIKNFKPSIGNTNLYTQEQVKEGGNCFLSFDMKKANFQTLKWANPAIVFDCNTYEDFIEKFTDMEWAKKSKRTREIIFGRLNPNRTMKYEKIIMEGVKDHLSKTVITEWFDEFSLNSDEVIYKLKSELDFNKAIKAVSERITEDNLLSDVGLNLRMEFFKLVMYQFKTYSSDKLMSVFVKEHSDGKKTYKCANEIYFPQTYKLINGMEINDDDLVFYYDKSELSKFLHPLELI